MLKWTQLCSCFIIKALFDGFAFTGKQLQIFFFKFPAYFTNTLHMLLSACTCFLFDVSSSASIVTYECHQMMMWCEIIDDFLSLVQIATWKAVALMGTQFCVERASQTLDPFWALEYKNREWNCQLPHYYSRMYVSYSAAVWILCCWLFLGGSSQTA